MRMKLWRGHCRGTIVLAVLVAAGGWAQQARAYALLGFPPQEAVLAGEYKTWPMDTVSPSSVELTFALDAGFASALAVGADTAALNAISTWNDAGSVLTSVDAGYQPVENTRTNFIDMFLGGGEWEGAAADNGLGANIDIMARGQDFSLVDYKSKRHGFKDSGQSGTGSLAFTVVNASNAQILSVDVYLNADYDWSTDGGHYDVETVVLHELGHAVGLDHPDQAVASGGANYDPWTFQPGKLSSGVEAMNSNYWPDGICRDLSEDDEGGLAFLYPGLSGDVNGDNAFRFSDVQLALDVFLGYGEPLGPAAFHNADWNGDGRLRFSDVQYSLDVFLGFADPAGPLLGDSVGGHGDTTKAVPEPGSLLLLMAGLLCHVRFRLPIRRSLVQWRGSTK